MEKTGCRFAWHPIFTSQVPQSAGGKDRFLLALLKYAQSCGNASPVHPDLLSTPSPRPMSKLASPPPYIDHTYLHPHRSQQESAMKALLSSTWHVLDQPPPPSLREILGAYRAKGDGDRDMLLAMLNAKTAEDQRIAAVASLHRTMLELHTYTAQSQPPVHPPEVHSVYPYQPHFPSPPTTSYQHSPPLHSHAHSESSSRVRRRTESTTSLHPSSAHIREREMMAESSHPRKRRRSSRSPPPSEHRQRTSAPDSRSLPQTDLPPSPYSTSSRSSAGSPRSRESMTIGSLLSESMPPRDPDTSSRRTSSERSTSSASPLRR
ncbi:hypothetical protein K474DRAFT_1708341 [Panus rudis PR-1116 ss-1]|nr:hypothetical protein K474DRAFT_1708341 [Panus rudis PR-1116 ss-1]